MEGELFISVFVFLLVIIIVFFAGQNHWTNNNSQEHAEGQPPLKTCVTTVEYRTGVGAHIFAYLNLVSYKKHTGNKILHGPYSHFEQLDHDPAEAEKFRVAFQMKKGGEAGYNNCAILERNLPENLQPKDNASQIERLLKHRKILKLYIKLQVLSQNY